MNAHYHRSKKGGGEWEFFDLPEQWSIHYKSLTFQFEAIQFQTYRTVSGTGGQLGLVLRTRSKTRDRPVKVLNLFAYTGGATLAAAAAGAQRDTR